MFTLLLLFFATGCAPVETNNNPGVNRIDTANTDTGSGIDSKTDTGKEVVGGNCGGPEPLEGDESFWVCSTGATGYAWPTAGGPGENCMTTEGWEYTVSKNGNSVTLTNRVDGRVITCELDE